MQKIVAFALLAAFAAATSGCAMVGRHSVPIEGGRQSTFGLISINGIGDGYPMIPLYSRVDLGVK